MRGLELARAFPGRPVIRQNSIFPQAYGRSAMTQLQQTEASCLLLGGALYRSRVGLVSASGPADLLFAGFKKGAFSLYFGDAPIYHFDLEGRWQRAYVDVTHFLKSLDTSVHAIDRVREGANLVLRRRALRDDEIRDLDLQVRGIALGLIAELDGGRLRRQEPPMGKARALDNAALRDFLVRIARWDAAAWDAHHRQYQATYGPLPFLPPDCQNAVVLQATHGSARGLSFGNGPASDHVIRSPAEFQQHVLDVARLVGRRLLQTRIAFLASGDVLRRPVDDVMTYLEILGRALTIAPAAKGQSEPALEDPQHIEGIYAFLDDFSAPCPGPSALQAFRQRHLEHVTLGVESGDARVRGLYHKSWYDDDLRAVVADAKSAGIGLSLLTLVGAGGQEHGKSHVEKSAQLFASLGLTRGDTLFLLDERELADPGREGGDGNALTGEAWTRQRESFQQALSPLRERGVKVLPYSLEKQWA